MQSRLLCKSTVLLGFVLSLFIACRQDDEIVLTEEESTSEQMIQSVMDGTVSDQESHLTFGMRKDLYELYIDKFRGVPAASENIEINLESYNDDSQGVVLQRNFQNTDKTVLITSEEGSVSWDVEVPEDALYQIYVEYYPVKGKNDYIERQIEINGEVPFYGARHFIMSRVWMDQGKPRVDNRGNQYRPDQVESPQFRSLWAVDYLGYHSEPYEFFLKAGENSLTLRSIKEPLAISRVVLGRKEAIPSYSEVQAVYGSASSRGAENIKIQAEDMYLKSDPMIYASDDHSSPATEPSHPSEIRLNKMGGDQWKLPGQWVSWEFEVEEEGLYKLAMRMRQNLVHGQKVNRRLMLDGETPFSEAEEFTFDFSSDWQMKILDIDGEEVSFYLTPGRHVLSLETSLGGLGPILRDVENTIYTLNYAYRKILMLTGPDPDPYRDYNLEVELPDVMTILGEQSLTMADLARRVEEYTDDRTQAALLNRLSHLTAKMYNDPYTIPKSLKELKGNAGSLATWVYTSREQPLEIDYIVFVPEGNNAPRGDAGFFRNSWYSIRSFFASFFEDYDSVGNSYDGEEEDILTVWILTGRDQAQLLKRMVDDTFTPRTGIPVNVKLVMPDVLLPATVAGRGPDVAMQLQSADPVNFAIRNALVDLSTFPDFDEVAQRFQPSSLVPFRYQDGVYALPETQEFLIMFYRTDIFDELGLEYPQTWEDMYDIMPDLQKNYLDFVIPVRTSVMNFTIYGSSWSYQMMLYQHGGQLYKGDGIAMDIDSEIGINAFEEWTSLFVNYSLPDYYDFRTRFRTGEIPIGVASYIEYNILKVYAPEIRGLWEFVPVPGTPQPDGTIDRSVPGWGLGTVMMESARNRDYAWEFMKWWSSTESQVRFGQELESVIGPAARHPTANVEAMAQLSWPVKEYESLQAQWEWVRGVPEVPGSYYYPRHLDNAFRSVYYEGTNPREALLEYTRKINDELTSKRAEFGLPTLEDLKDEE